MGRVFTRPAWGATCGSRRGFSWGACFNSRAPRGARPPRSTRGRAARKFQFTRPAWGATGRWRGASAVGGVSIHAPRVGRDFWRGVPAHVEGVSIHAPRVGRDDTLSVELSVMVGFNSRAPRGARLSWQRKCGVPVPFQFTRPAWGATRHSCLILLFFGFNSRAPRGARRAGSRTPARRGWFQFTRPAWGATRARPWAWYAGGFNSRAPRGARRTYRTSTRHA
mgnify:CR=1 FL=1